MFYSFQLWRHPNVRYREAVQRLSCCELFCMLKNLSVDTEIIPEMIGSAPFLSFESRELSPEELVWLRGHSCIVFMAEKHGTSLVPLPVSPDLYMPEELPEVLKYKGKTSPTLMRMMMNTAVALSPFAHSVSPLTVLDPLCGRGTGLYCALLAGYHAVGIEQDRRDVKEIVDYFSRFLKLNRLKHAVSLRGATVRGCSVPMHEFVFASTKEAFVRGDIRRLSVFEGDTGLAGSLLRKSPANILLADLPYGIQHAPQENSHRTDSMEHMLSRVLPAWKSALVPGGVIVLSYNTLTLKPLRLRDLLNEAGFSPVNDPVFSGLTHSVEQAIVRDVIFAAVPGKN